MRILSGSCSGFTSAMRPSVSPRRAVPFFFLGFVIATFSNYNLIGLGIIGTVFAILYIQLSPRFNAAQSGKSATRQAPLADNELEGL